jgi:hypothetical protein
VQNILLQQLQKREWPLCTAFFFVYEPPPDMGILVVSPVGRPRCPNLLESMYRVSERNEKALLVDSGGGAVQNCHTKTRRSSIEEPFDFTLYTWTCF